MNAIRFVLLILMAVVCYACKPQVSETLPPASTKLVEYFATLPLRETPYADFQGVIKLSAQQALIRNHYRFEYDDSLRLKSISFQLGNTLRNPNHTANYFFTSPMQRFEYEKNREIRTFYDRWGNQVAQRGAYREVYELDELGKRVALLFEDQSGNPVENSWGIATYKWKQQPDGSVIETRSDLQGSPKSLRPHFEFFRIRLYYEQNGMLALMQNIDEQGNLLENDTGVAQDKLLFDKEGRWLGWNVLNKNHHLQRGNGPNVAKGINVANQYGYEQYIHYEDIDGRPIINSHGFWGGKRYYDSVGNYSYTHFVDSLGNPGLNERSGYCYAMYTWDKRRLNRLKIELLDIDKNLIPHKNSGYAIITYDYDSLDNLIKTSYLGVDGENITRNDNGVSYITYNYDEYSALVATKRYNQSGELLSE